MTARATAVRNDYRCSIDRNQSGKYCVRIQVHYRRHAWTLGTFFLASSFDRAMKKLEVPAFVLGPMRRGLAESVEMPREFSRSTAVGS